MEPSLGKRRKLRKIAQQKATAYLLNPERQYRQDIERVLRQLAKYIAQYGFCPTTPVLAKKNSWRKEGCEAYLQDLMLEELVELHLGRAWNPTVLGYERIGKIPLDPLLAPDISVRATNREEARRIANRLRDPEVKAAYDALYKNTYRENQARGTKKTG